MGEIMISNDIILTMIVLLLGLVLILKRAFKFENEKSLAIIGILVLMLSPIALMSIIINNEHEYRDKFLIPISNGCYYAQDVLTKEYRCFTNNDYIGYNHIDKLTLSEVNSRINYINNMPSVWIKVLITLYEGYLLLRLLFIFPITMKKEVKNNEKN